MPTVNGISSMPDRPGTHLEPHARTRRVRTPRLRDLPFLLSVAAFVAWFLLLSPTVLGGPATYVWVSGISMEPTLETGDLVIVRRADDYAVGDVIAFRVPPGQPGAGALVIHRIVGGSAETGFVTQGDNKRRPDSWRPTPQDILGSSWLVAPGAGFLVSWLREPSVFAALAAALTVFCLMLAGGRSHGSRPSPPAVGVNEAALVEWPRAGAAAAAPLEARSTGLRRAPVEWRSHDRLSARIARPAAPREWR
jgi:signal peptidase I